MKIAHVDAERGFSGGEVQVFLLMEGLRERGHENVLVCPPGSRAGEVARSRELETRAVPMRSDVDLPAVLRLTRVLRDARPDLVHLHTGRATWLGGLAARRAGVPAITTRRMDRTVKRNLRNRWIYGGLVRRAVAISEAVRDLLHAGGVDPARTLTIPSTVDPARLVPGRPRADVRAELGTAEEALVLFTACALYERKGIDVLLDAMARVRGAGPGTPNLPPFEAWIAGDGPERAALEARRRELGLEHVRFLGRRDDVPDLLHAADVFVLPSRQEGLGIAALEAMAAGRPVVASRVGGLGQAVVDGRTGRLVPPADAPALAAALHEVLADTTLRERWGAAGPERIAEAYLPERMVEAYEALYREVLAEVAR